jgi:hypothetical protein
MAHQSRNRPPITITIAPDVIERAKAEAIRRRSTLSRFVEVLLAEACPEPERKGAA